MTSKGGGQRDIVLFFFDIMPLAHLNYSCAVDIYNAYVLI